MQRQAADLHAAIDKKDSAKVRELIDRGGADISMIDASIEGSTVRCLHRAAFVGDVEVMSILLAEIDDSWPQDAKKHFLDCRTVLNCTPLIVASVCGHKEVAQMLEEKGCRSDLVSSIGNTAKKLADEFKREVHVYRHVYTHIHARACTLVSALVYTLTVAHIDAHMAMHVDTHSYRVSRLV